VVVGGPPTVKAADLPLQLSEKTGIPTGDSLAQMERAHIQKILARTDWNITRAAEILKIDRVTIYNKVKKYGLQR
jgi:transcriptional regulator of acetoin/glycerol metabolism